MNLILLLELCIVLCSALKTIDKFAVHHFFRYATIGKKNVVMVSLPESLVTFLSVARKTKLCTRPCRGQRSVLRSRLSYASSECYAPRRCVSLIDATITISSFLTTVVSSGFPAFRVFFLVLDQHRSPGWPFLLRMEQLTLYE